MLAPEASRVVAVAGAPGAGRTTAVINLAAALTAQGKDVLVIDECPGPQSVCAMLGIARGAGNLATVMSGQLSLADAARRPALGYGVIVASRDNRAPYTGEQLRRVVEGTGSVILIDADLDDHGALSPLALHAHDVMIVTRIAALAITETYATLKRLHIAHAIGQFRMLSNGVPGATVGDAAIEHLAGVAGRYLGVALQNVGAITEDPLMAHARRLGRSIVDAFASATAARDYRSLAAELAYWPLRPALSSRLPAAAGNKTPTAPRPVGRRADSPGQQPSTQHA